MRTGQQTLRVQGSMAGFEQAAHQLRAVLDDHQVAGRPRFHVQLIFEEIVTNVIRYGHADDAVHHIDVSIVFGDDIMMTVEDDGRPFDPLQRPNPTLPKSLEAAPLGGLGILIARQVSKDLRYERTADGRNRLAVTIAR